MEAGHLWNHMNDSERRKMLQEAGYEKATIDKYSTKKWNQIERSYRENFGRVVAIYHGEILQAIGF